MSTILRNPAWSSFTWLGMTAGVSLLATPLRFGAETISRAVALDVGRVVFNGLNKAEFVALVIILVQLRISGHTRALWIPVFALALILIAQASWLLPELSSRTDIVIAGGEPPPSIAHAAYSTLELAKLTLLAFTGFRALQLLR
jgi:hypothetical protein